MSGSLTYEFVGAIISVVIFTAILVYWIFREFQTKADAKEVEMRFFNALRDDSASHKKAVEDLRKDFDQSFESMEDQIKIFRDDTKSEIRLIQQEISAMRTLFAQVANDTGWTRGRLETITNNNSGGNKSLQP